MAPALTQATEPLTLAEATRHTASPFFTKYQQCLKLPASLLSRNPYTNGDKFSAGLAPPLVFGRADCHSPPARFGRIMEQYPPLPNSDDISPIPEEVLTRAPPEEYTPSPESPSPILNDMGCHTHNSMDSPLASVDSDAYNPKLKALPEINFCGQQNDILNYTDGELGNVTDIIHTLQNMVRNPELLSGVSQEELNSSVQASIDTPYEETTEERTASLLGKLTARQKQLDRKQEFFLRRLRRVSARGLTASVSSQLDYLVSRGSKLQQDKDAGPSKRPDHQLHSDSLKIMTTSNLVDYIRKVEAIEHQRNQGESLVTKTSPPLPEGLRAEADYIVAEMKAATLGQVGHDSDATESSSGGESCDELETFHSTNFIPIRERALYKYCHRRGWMASKWAWLRAQIADLDYKIVQQEKTYMHLRGSKGDVTFVEESANGGKTKKILNQQTNASLHDSRQCPLTRITPPSMRFTVNGYHPSALDDAPPLPPPSSSMLPPNSMENSCARTLAAGKLKRRRYIRPSAVLRRNRRSYTGSSLSVSAYRAQNRSATCSCVAPLTCVLCTNLQANSVYNVYGVQFVKTRDLASLVQNKQNVKEKLANVDPSFHPVLSRGTEILQNEAYTNCLSGSHFRETLTQSKDDVIDDVDEPLSKRKKREFRELRKKKRDGLRVHIGDGGRRLLEQDLIEEEDDWEVSSGHQELFLDKKDKSIVHDKAKKGSSSHKHKSNHSANSYDIDNIVIPQSMASISLVDTLPYKEIMTPKWRICQLSPIHSLSLLQSDSDEVEEDVSEEAFKARHAVSEDRERKYFRSIQMKANQRSHRSRRADSSGTNTPDQPMSPRPLDHFIENSPVGSPLVEQSEDSNHSTKSGQSVSNTTVFTLSLSAIQSSILNPSGSSVNGPHSTESNAPSPIIGDVVVGTTLARSHRSVSAGSDKFFRPITPASASHDGEKECPSPFPYRDFPLNESEYDTLRHVTLKGKSHCGRQRTPDGFGEKGHRRVFQGMEKDKSGRESPLSEVTDSASEEEDCEADDGSAPHWTISGVKDRSGACVLQVHRN